MEPDLTKLAEILDGKYGDRANAILKKLVARPNDWHRIGTCEVLRDLFQCGIVLYKWVETTPRSHHGYAIDHRYISTIERLLAKPTLVTPEDVARKYAGYTRWLAAPLGAGVRVCSDYAAIIPMIAGKGKLKAKHISRLMHWGRHMNKSINQALLEFSVQTGLAKRDARGYWEVPNGPALKAIVCARKKVEQIT